MTATNDEFTVQWLRNRKRNAQTNISWVGIKSHLEHSNIICISTYQKKLIDAIKGSAYNFNSIGLQM